LGGWKNWGIIKGKGFFEGVSKMGKERIRFYAVLAVVAMMGAGCMPRAFRVEVIPSGKELHEEQIGGDTGFWLKNKIAVIEVDGVISNSADGGWFGDGENAVSVFQEKLDKAKNDEDVKAIVLRINSPGGTVAASDLMYHSLREFKRKTKKPVVASIMDCGASGAYYLACGADGIMMQPSGITGSIGVIAQVVSFQGTMNKIGMKTATIKSGKLKDMGSIFHDMTEEERAVFEKLIMSFYEQFLGVVGEGRRDLGGEKLRGIADGRVYTADEAIENGLVDRKGYPQDAIDWAKKMAGVEKAKTIMYCRPAGYKPNIYSSTDADKGLAGALINVELPEWLNSGGAHFLYLWQPGAE
jgi:protease IV